MRPVTGLAIFEIRGCMHINFYSGSLTGFFVRVLCVIALGTVAGSRVHPGFQIGVTGQAQIRIIRQEKIFQIGFVGAVALAAFAVHNRVVAAFNVLDFLSGIRAVAGIT